MVPRIRRIAGLGAAIGSVLWLVGSTPAGAADTPSPKALAVTHMKWDNVDPMLTAGEGTGGGQAAARNVGSPVCGPTATSPSADVNTDCFEANGPHNETSIAVNPTSSSNIIGGLNDYQIRLSNGGNVYETTYTRAHVSMDGGQTWSFYGLGNQYNAYTSTGDPSVAFDANGRAYLATLGFGWSQGNGCCRTPDVIVNTSTDGGKHWSNFTRVAQGTGVETGPGIFNDKEYVAAWGDGNAIVTWTHFVDGFKGSYVSSPIYDSVTHDGGVTWSSPRSISGSGPSFCVSANSSEPAHVCDQDQGSVPTVSPDGSIHVAFLSTDNSDPNTAGFNRDQYLVVAVNPTTGAALGPPAHVADLVDGNYDAPLNIDGRQTYGDSQFRSWSIGGIAADPTSSSHLAITWSDWRNSTYHPGSPSGDFNPYDHATNADVFVSESTDGGSTWGAPQQLPGGGANAAADQFQPFAAFDSGGNLRVGYFDRSYDTANHAYGYTVATKSGGSWTAQEVSTVLSDPTSGTRWFSGRTPNTSFPHPTTFLGDYSNVAGDGTGVVALWTDMRNSVTFGGRTGSGQDAYFASAT